MIQSSPLYEFDPDPVGLFHPGNIYGVDRPRIPSVAVLCFFSEVIEQLALRDNVEVVGRLAAAHGVHQIYRLHHDGEPVAVLNPGWGAPLSAAALEEAIALGADRLVACGGAGALTPELPPNHIVVPTSAVRDEGTSYHYLPPGREISADPASVATIERVLEEQGVPFTEGKTWTTDAIYRETRTKIARRRSEGCLTVEMEAAAFLAVAQFRQVRFAQIFYAADDLSGDVWDHRHWKASQSRQTTFDLAIDIALAL